jgi:Set1/Ash2 histone methyltransferase complex subunit ASH2
MDNNISSARATSRSASPGTGGMTEPTAVAPVVASAVSSKRRGKAAVSNPLDAVTAAALSTAAQHMTASGFHGLSSLLINALQEGQQHATLIPSVESVQQAAKKAIADQPVWVHWSKQDMAPQFKCDAARLSLTGAMRGYRMARASHGVSAGCFYFEVIVLPGPSATEMLASLPPNARLGPGLREQLQLAVEWEECHGKSNRSTTGTGHLATEGPTALSMEGTTYKKRKTESPQQHAPQVGGHVRIGWSMRTGDLQAPVGYDKWSYGIRDIEGSIIHCSQRQDNWGGDGFSAGDVIGCAICFDESDAGTKHEDDDNENDNHIRFFKNSDCMGQFVLTKGKREGGEAFRNIERGIYYPAVSCYMGGAVRVNFGPYWVCPPKRSRLPSGLKNLKPISSLLPPPILPDEAVNNATATAKLFRKFEHQQALKDAVKAEAEVHCQAYADFMKNHLEEVRQGRIARGLSVADLPDVESSQKESGDVSTGVVR